MILLDDEPYKYMWFKARHGLPFINLIRQGHPSAVMIIEQQILTLARKLYDQDSLQGNGKPNDEHDVEVCPAPLQIYDRHFPDFSTWWIMV